MPAAQKSAAQKNRCSARDRWEAKCIREKAPGEERWCSIHVDEQNKLYKDYKRCTSELQSHAKIEACTDPNLIRTCEAVPSLKEWHTAARRRWILANRAIEARSYHHNHFYSDIDFGHAKFIENLKRERKSLETALIELERRAHSLILQLSHASFVLETDEARFPKPTDDNECVPLPPPKKTGRKHPLASEAEVENPLEAVYKQRREELLEELLSYLHYACGYSDPCIAHERKLIYDAVFRLIILRDPALALAAQGYERIDDFLVNCQELQNDDLARLCNALHLATDSRETLGRRENVLREAVQNVLFRNPEDEPEGDKTWFLGGWLYKTPAKGDMPLRGWDHMSASIGCSNCIVSCTRSLAELISIRKHAILPKDKPRFSMWNPLEEAEDLVLCSLGILCGLENDSVFRSVYKETDPTRKQKTVWKESQDRAWFSFRIHIDEPWAAQFVYMIKRKYDTVVRNGRKDITYMSSNLWMRRHRSARTRVALQSADWTVDLAMLPDSFYFAPGPEKKWSLDFTRDAYDIIVLDHSATPGQTTLASFKRDVTYIAAAVQGYDVKTFLRVFDKPGEEAEREERKWRESVDVGELDLSWRCSPGTMGPHSNQLGVQVQVHPPDLSPEHQDRLARIWAACIFQSPRDDMTISERLAKALEDVESGGDD